MCVTHFRSILGPLSCDHVLVSLREGVTAAGSNTPLHVQFESIIESCSVQEWCVCWGGVNEPLFTFAGRRWSFCQVFDIISGVGRLFKLTRSRTCREFTPAAISACHLHVGGCICGRYYEILLADN